MKKNISIAIDLGATSGRVFLGWLENKKLVMEKLSHFANSPISLNGVLYWDILMLWKNVISALQSCGEQNLDISTVGVDTWGVDFGLLGEDGNLLANPVCYRDSGTEGIGNVIAKKIDEKVLYAITGFGYTRVSTLAQLVALNEGKRKFLIDMAKTFLLMPDLFRYYLCGEISCELTAAGGSLLLDVEALAWSHKLRRIFKLPERIFPPLTKPATIAGALRSTLVRETGLKRVSVVAPVGHDTVCVPEGEERRGYLGASEFQNPDAD